jgi:division/cell wall cluster transcriptional repressor MraZ
VDLFIGKQECSVDEKRRFSLPPKFRPLFGAEAIPSGYTHHVVLIPWYGGALAAFPVPRWEEIQARITFLDYTTPDFLDAKRACLPRMERVHTDPEGRLLLTPEQHAWLRLTAGSKDRLVVAGVGQHCEVWNAAEWAELEKTGRNPATRPPADVEYDKQLEVLMRAARSEENARVRPPAGSDDKVG